MFGFPRILRHWAQVECLNADVVWPIMGGFGAVASGTRRKDGKMVPACARELSSICNTRAGIWIWKAMGRMGRQ
ncbi:hypothetical protein AA16373_1144 [Komagataeibacter swingsii DSM 16373]|nr:hypothetical protein AA16373_1144 [Komagataeibacter swingsii DSM 16373]